MRKEPRPRFEGWDVNERERKDSAGRSSGAMLTGMVAPGRARTERTKPVRFPWVREVFKQKSQRRWCPNLVSQMPPFGLGSSDDAEGHQNSLSSIPETGGENTGSMTVTGISRSITHFPENHPPLFRQPPLPPPQPRGSSFGALCVCDAFCLEPNRILRIPTQGPPPWVISSFSSKP